jgi:hypothetical protein
MKRLSVISSFLFPLFALAQQEIRINPQDSTEGIEVVFIPREMTADSLMQHIYHFNPNRYGIGHTQRFGWLKLSEKFDTDEFYQWTKKYCIERVGEGYFYENFRVYRHSFKDNANTEIYEIHYLFFPPGFGYDHQRITFKKYVFLGIEEVQPPANLPDCRSDPAACDFPVNREAAMKIALEQVVKGREMQVRIEDLTYDFKWECKTYTEGYGRGEDFSIDARTGKVSAPKGWQRID